MPKISPKRLRGPDEHATAQTGTRPWPADRFFSYIPILWHLRGDRRIHGGHRRVACDWLFAGPSIVADCTVHGCHRARVRRADALSEERHVRENQADNHLFDVL